MPEHTKKYVNWKSTHLHMHRRDEMWYVEPAHISKHPPGGMYVITEGDRFSSKAQ